jgi:hypothetical protein
MRRSEYCRRRYNGTRNRHLRILQPFIRTNSWLVKEFIAIMEVSYDDRSNRPDEPENVHHIYFRSLRHFDVLSRILWSRSMKPAETDM